MKINHIIKEKRISLSLTQEQIADRLGVSTPAVNKWEKGSSYPDITLLPPLARLLQIDLNTLLSFEDDLSDKEVYSYVNSLPEAIQINGFEIGFNDAMSWIHKYPNCELLIYNVAMLLDGFLTMQNIENKEHYEQQIEELYMRILDSNNADIRNQVISMLISKKISKGDFSEAGQLIDKLSNTPPTTSDKDLWRANLFIKQGENYKALNILQNKLLNSINNIQSLLMKLMSLAIQDHRIEDANELATIISDSSKLFKLWNGFSYTAHLEIAVNESDAKKTIELMRGFLEVFKELPVEVNSPLYDSIKLKPLSPSFYHFIASSLLNDIQTSNEYDFIKDNPTFSELLKQCEALLK